MTILDAITARELDEALMEAAAVARREGREDFAAWCERSVHGEAAHGEDPDPLARATIDQMAAQVTPEGAETLWLGELPSRLLDLLDDPNATTAAEWGLYAAAQAALALAPDNSSAYGDVA